MNLRDQRLKKYLKQAGNILPELDISEIFSLYTGEEPASGKITFSNQTDVFKKLSKFKEGTTLIHYTSIDSLFSILNSDILRMYNCVNKNDPWEINHANSKYEIGLNDLELLDFKQNNFITSFFEYDMRLQNDNKYLWNEYGNKGKGAGLVFEIENMNDSWEECYIGKVCYEDSSIPNSIYKRFIEFVKFHNEFNNQYHLFENTPSILSAIALHFKEVKWASENEVRIFAYCPFDKYDLKPLVLERKNNYLLSTIEHSVNGNGEIISYVSLPLNRSKVHDKLRINLGTDLSLNYLKSIPHLKLKRIVLGNNLQEADKINRIENIEKILNWHAMKNKTVEIQLGFSEINWKEDSHATGFSKSAPGIG